LFFTGEVLSGQSVGIPYCVVVVWLAITTSYLYVRYHAAGLLLDKAFSVLFYFYLGRVRPGVRRIFTCQDVIGGSICGGVSFASLAPHSVPALPSAGVDPSRSLTLSRQSAGGRGWPCPSLHSRLPIYPTAPRAAPRFERGKGRIHASTPRPSVEAAASLARDNIGSPPCRNR